MWTSQGNEGFYVIVKFSVLFHAKFMFGQLICFRNFFISENDSSGPDPLIMLVPQICFLTGLTDTHRKDFKVSGSVFTTN